MRRRDRACRRKAIVHPELGGALSAADHEESGRSSFYDGGNVYSAINFNNFTSNYTNTVGIGLRYSTPIGPIRIDLGHNLNPVPGINPTQYYITLGQAF